MSGSLVADHSILAAAIGDDVLLTGRGDRGVINAICNRVENEAGCSWLFRGQLGEISSVRGDCF